MAWQNGLATRSFGFSNAWDFDDVVSEWPGNELAQDLVREHAGRKYRSQDVTPLTIGMQRRILADAERVAADETSSERREVEAKDLIDALAVSMQSPVPVTYWEVGYRKEAD